MIFQLEKKQKKIKSFCCCEICFEVVTIYIIYSKSNIKLIWICFECFKVLYVLVYDGESSRVWLRMAGLLYKVSYTDILGTQTIKISKITHSFDETNFACQ